MEENHYDPRVFRAKDPPCAKCHEAMDFKLYADYDGIDWLQWYCKATCGYYFNIELV